MSDGLRIMLERQGYRVLRRATDTGKSFIYQHVRTTVILE